MANSTILSNIHHFITEHTLLSPKTTVILGLSGGPDSVFLLHVLAQLREQDMIKEIIAAHLDHEWRSNSGDDVQFCKQLTKQYNVDFVSKKLSELALKLRPNGSKEEFGRQARRHFFTKIQQHYSADAIALAHHRQDLQETFFIRLLRGASLSGLTAIKARDGNYIRPLLETNKQDILTFLDNQKIPYLIDPTNNSPDFLRNRLRINVIPALRSCDARFDRSFDRTLENLQSTEHFLDLLTQETFNKLAHMMAGTYYLDCQQLMDLHPVMRKRILIHWLCLEAVKFPVSSGFLDEIIRFLGATQSNTHRIVSQWHLGKTKGQIFIAKSPISS